MRVAVGANHHGFETRARILELLAEGGHEPLDAKTPEAGLSDYPGVAAAVARKVSLGEADRGILIGGSGMGMCIAANKFPGVRAVNCHDDLLAEISRRFMDSNVLCLSAQLLSRRAIDSMVGIWLRTPFEGGRHVRRIEEFAAAEEEGVLLLLQQTAGS